LERGGPSSSYAQKGGRKEEKDLTEHFGKKTWALVGGQGDVTHGGFAKPKEERGKGVEKRGKGGGEGGFYDCLIVQGRAGESTTNTKS